MKQHEVQVGKTYVAKVNDKLAKVKITDVSPHGGWVGTNIATGKSVRIKSAQRLRHEDGAQPSARGKGKSKAGTQAGAAGGAAQADGTQPKQPKTRKKAAREDGSLSGLDAAAKVLTDAGEALNAKEMFERIQAQGLWKSGGKTPQATLYSAILREIQKKGGEARFRKDARGKFAIA